MFQFLLSQPQDSHLDIQTFSSIDYERNKLTLKGRSDLT